MQVLKPNWMWFQFITGDLNTNLKMTCFLFHHEEATVERSDLVQVTLKGTRTTIHLLSRFCSAGLDPVPADTGSKLSLTQTVSSSQSWRHECLRACMTNGWTESCWMNYKWFSILFGLNCFKWINRQNVLMRLCILLMEANAAPGISANTRTKGWRRKRQINQMKRHF